MTAGLTDHDWELLSTYLDSSLSPAETRDVEERLLSDPGFKAALVSLRQTRAILRSAPLVKRRRNFYLTPEMAGQRKWTWLIPVFNLSSAATGLLAVILLVLNLLPSGMRAAPAQQVMMSAPVVQAPAGNAAAEDMSLAPTVMEPDSAPAAQPELMNEAAQPAEPAIAPSMSLDQPSPETEGMATKPEAAMPAPPAAAPLMAKGEESTAGSAAAATPETFMAPKAVVEDQVFETSVPAPTLLPENTRVMEATPSHMVELPTAVAENVLPSMKFTPAITQENKEAVIVETQLESSIPEFSNFWPGAILLLVSILLGTMGFILRKRFR